MTPERTSRERPVTIEVDMPYEGEVTWGHLRMHHPETIARLFEDVRQGKLPRDALRGLASPARLDALLGVKWDAVRIGRILPAANAEPGRGVRIAPHCSETISYGFRRSIFEEDYTLFVNKPFKLKVSTW